MGYTSTLVIEGSVSVEEPKRRIIIPTRNSIYLKYLYGTVEGGPDYLIYLMCKLHILFNNQYLLFHDRTEVDSYDFKVEGAEVLQSVASWSLGRMDGCLGA